MYNEYYGFTEAPFSVSPDPRFDYSNAFYQEAFATLRYGIEAQKGFIVITGEAGTGKTTLLRRLMQSFGPNIQTAYVFNTHLSFKDLLRLVLNDLGLPNFTEDRLEMIAQLNDYLIEQLQQGNVVTLLVDEAQELSIDMLEEIRLLSNLETDTEKLLQIVLMGQPELERKLDEPELRQLKQRVALRCRLDPLPAHEVGSYIVSRLKAVGYDGAELFYPSAVDKIAHFSRGIPRLINIICDNGLLIAYADSKKRVTGEMIEEVARDLRLHERVPIEKDGRAAVVSQEGTIEHLEGFRSRHPMREDFAKAGAASGSDFVMNLDDKEPVGARARKKSTRGRGVAFLVLTLLLVIAGALVYSQWISTEFAAVSENKNSAEFRQPDAASPEPALPTERLKPDLFAERYGSEALPPDMPPGEVEEKIDSTPALQGPQSKDSPATEKKTPPPVTKRTPDDESIKAAERKRTEPPSQRPARSVRETRVSDAALELQVQRAISIRAIQGVGISVRDGTVYLKGRVATPRQRLAATRAARSVEGVKAVDNQIVIY